MKVVKDDQQRRHAMVLEMLETLLVIEIEMLETVLAMEMVGQAKEVYSLKELLEQVR